LRFDETLYETFYDFSSEVNLARGAWTAVGAGSPRAVMLDCPSP
jgi:hypothetical protein